jgi:hypothetical protein
MATSTKISIADLAAETEVAPRRIRRTLRSLEMGVGKGTQYALTAKQATKVRNALSTDAE